MDSECTSCRDTGWVWKNAHVRPCKRCMPLIQRLLMVLEDRVPYRLGRIECRLLGSHNRSCRGRNDHVTIDGRVIH